MARRTATTFRSSRRHGNFIWSAILLDQVSFTVAAQGLALVVSADYALAASQGQATLMAIRGWLSLSNGSSTNRESLYMAIVKKDEDESPTGLSMDPGIAEFYTKEDILWTAGWLNPAFQTAAGERSQYHEILNIKAKRKLKSGQDISLQFASNGGAPTSQLSGVLRALIKVG